ncbi:hypothetical protein HG531_011675 [Fusarium graminearum]|nr:hypothetical protein HG531_011675 [Fusarium graminearum]
MARRKTRPFHLPSPSSDTVTPASLQFQLLAAQDDYNEFGALALLLVLVASLVRRKLAGTARNLGGDLEEDLAVITIVVGRYHRGIVGMRVIIDQVHDDGAAAVGSGMLGQVIASGELLATLVTLKRLLLCVERAVVTLEVFLAAETAVAKIADKGLGGILGKRLLASSAVGRSGEGSRRTLGARGGTRVATLSSLVGRLLGVARVGSGSSNVHDGSSVTLLRLSLLDTLVLVAIFRSTSGSTGGRRAGVRRELESLVLVKRQILVTNEATVAERDN